MADIQIPNDIVLFGYTGSPYTERIKWYLNLRQMPYAQCFQPRILPRPDLQFLGIHYRRIPLLSIGSDVYADTRLILRALDERFPKPPKTPKPQLRGIDYSLPIVPRPLPREPLMADLLESAGTEGGLFTTAVALIPADAPMLKDPAFIADRNEMMGGNKFGDLEARKVARPHALVRMRQAFVELEAALKGPHMWLARGDAVGAEDLNAFYIPEWLSSIPGAWDEEVLGWRKFPHVYSWMERIRRRLKYAGERLGAPVKVSGEQAARNILQGRFAQDPAETQIVEGDPLGLHVGDEVRVWPSDYGSNHKDQGRLVGLKIDEIVLEIRAANGQKLRLHTPRRGFRIQKVSDRTNSSL